MLHPLNDNTSMLTAAKSNPNLIKSSLLDVVKQFRFMPVQKAYHKERAIQNKHDKKTWQLPRCLG